MLDVMGMSHANSAKVAAFHQMEPDKPLAMTECCSCQNQRGEDADQPHNKTEVHYTSNVARCLDGQTSVSDVPEYVAGTFVWSESRTPTVCPLSFEFPATCANYFACVLACLPCDSTYCHDADRVAIQKTKRCTTTWASPDSGHTSRPPLGLSTSPAS